MQLLAPACVGFAGTGIGNSIQTGLTTSICLSVHPWAPCLNVMLSIIASVSYYSFSWYKFQRTRFLGLLCSVVDGVWLRIKHGDGMPHKHPPRLQFRPPPVLRPPISYGAAEQGKYCLRSVSPLSRRTCLGGAVRRSPQVECSTCVAALPVPLVADVSFFGRDDVWIPKLSLWNGFRYSITNCTLVRKVDRPVRCAPKVG